MSFSLFPQGFPHRRGKLSTGRRKAFLSGRARRLLLRPFLQDACFEKRCAAPARGVRSPWLKITSKGYHNRWPGTREFSLASAPEGSVARRFLRSDCGGNKALLQAARPGHRQQKSPARRAGDFLFFQHSLAPAGMASSTMIRCSFSSPFSVCTALISMPWLSSPIILRGGRLTMAMRVLPTSSSGL